MMKALMLLVKVKVDLEVKIQWILGDEIRWGNQIKLKS